MKHYHVHEAKILQKTRKVSFYPTKPKTLCEKIPQKKYTCIALYGKKSLPRNIKFSRNQGIEESSKCLQFFQFSEAPVKDNLVLRHNKIVLDLRKNIHTLKKK